MILIDTVYQKVLTFANKEQRGYITPQQFNLFADMAQKEIFEQYFYDLNQIARAPGRSEEYSDYADNLNEKVAIFEKTTTGSPNSLATDLYRLGTVISNGKEVEEVQQNELLYMNQSYLTAPKENRKVYVRTGDKSIDVTPTTANVGYTYVHVPSKPSWAYVVVNERAMYDSSNAVNFQLHQAEESELVYRILAFAGISMKKPDLTQAAVGMETAKQQQEKK
tara:strand:+ start:45 stop:710 length:666 start_codon:yes stop_codon:yes gene_type:complete